MSSLTKWNRRAALIRGEHTVRQVDPSLLNWSWCLLLWDGRTVKEIHSTPQTLQPESDTELLWVEGGGAQGAELWGSQHGSLQWRNLPWVRRTRRTSWPTTLKRSLHTKTICKLASKNRLFFFLLPLCDRCSFELEAQLELFWLCHTELISKVRHSPRPPRCTGSGGSTRPRWSFVCGWKTPRETWCSLTAKSLCYRFIKPQLYRQNPGEWWVQSSCCVTGKRLHLCRITVLRRKLIYSWIWCSFWCMIIFMYLFLKKRQILCLVDI